MEILHTVIMAFKDIACTIIKCRKRKTRRVVPRKEEQKQSRMEISVEAGRVTIKVPLEQTEK